MSKSIKTKEVEQLFQAIQTLQNTEELFFLKMFAQ